MNYKEEYANILQTILPNFNKDALLTHIEYPPDMNMCDYAFATFFLAKEFKKKPIDIANELLEKLNSIDQNIFDFSVVNGYINAKINSNNFFKTVIEEVLTKGKNYGSLELPSKQYVLDEFNLNPLKTFHVGHLRMAVTGDAIYRLFKFANQDIKPVYYGGDVGTHVAKWLWYYLSLSDSEKQIPKENISKWFGTIYMKAGEKLAKDITYKKEIDELQKQLITDVNLQTELKNLVNLCLESYIEIAKDLDIKIEHKLLESMAENKFNEIKDNLINKFDFIKESEGAVIADLKPDNLDVLPIIKSNGALLYGAKDIGLVKLKQSKYPNNKNYLYVVDYRQEFYFKQLFNVFSKIYPDTNHIHIGHGTVSLSKKAIVKSREGEIVLYEDFKEALFNKTKSILEENDLDYDESIIKEISFGTIKFEMLKVGLNKNIIFNLENALDLQGDSSVYIQYSGVRSKSILRKSNNLDLSVNDLKKLSTVVALEQEERNLLKQIYLFSDKVSYAFNELKPNMIATYCLDLAHTYNKFYNNCSVLNSDEQIKQRRLLLIKSYLITLENALNLLGINVPDKM